MHAHMCQPVSPVRLLVCCTAHATADGADVYLQAASRQLPGSCCMSFQCLPTFRSQHAAAPQAASARACCQVACQISTGVQLGLIQGPPAGMLRTACRLREAGSFPNPAQLSPGGQASDEAGSRATWLSVVYSHPEWLVRRWLDVFGDKATGDLLRADNWLEALMLHASLAWLELLLRIFSRCAHHMQCPCSFIGVVSRSRRFPFQLWVSRMRADMCCAQGLRCWQNQNPQASISGDLQPVHCTKTCSAAGGSFSSKKLVLSWHWTSRCRGCQQQQLCAAFRSMESGQTRPGSVCSSCPT